MAITPIQILQDTVTKIATSSNSILIERQFKVGQQMSWLKVVKIAGAAAPNVAEMNNNGVHIFQLDPAREIIESTVLADVYVMCNDGGAPGDYGKLVIWEDYRSFLNPNGGMDVNSGDKTDESFSAYMGKLNGVSSTLAAEAVQGGKTLELADSTGFVDLGSFGMNSSTGDFYFGSQVGAPAGNVITIDSPLDGTFPIGTVIAKLDRNMAVDGSTTSQVFRFGPGPGGVIRVNRLAMYIQDGTAMDDSRFGGGIPLVHGLVFRINRGGNFVNKWNVKTNGEMALVCASDFNYTDKAPAGSFGARARNSYAGVEKHGVSHRLEFGDFIEIVVQDDLSGEEFLYFMPQGYIVS